MTDRFDDKETGWKLDNSYVKLPELLYCRQNPTPVRSPKLVLLNNSLATYLGLDIHELQSSDGIDILAGNKIPNESIPIAQAYAGHQFGNFTMLGDGRAILLGEQITPQNERFDIQLKGSGKTKYSRRGDGRAALGPMLREYIISEAMQALGIPTTRSLAVVTTGETVIRDPIQPGAILTRVAASHIRVGTFQYVSKWGTVDDLKALADYTLQRHFTNYESSDNKYLYLLQEVIRRQAELIAKWQIVGFIHGVMNTDNMAISGETIDYGPCAFMDIYDANTVFSSIDFNGRYAYYNQPGIAQWNLSRFAETLIPLLDDNQEQAVNIAQYAISEFCNQFHGFWLKGMSAKIGIYSNEKNDESLIDGLLSMMQKYHADYTNTFRALTLDKLVGIEMFYTNEFIQWKELWKARLVQQKKTKAYSEQLMKNSNPAIIPRNHRVEEALEAATNDGNYSVMERLLNVITKPYAYSDDQDEYAILPETSKCGYQTFCGT